MEEMIVKEKAANAAKAVKAVKAVDEGMAKEEVEVQAFTMAVEVAAKETTSDSMDTAVDVASMATRQWIAE